MNDTVWTDAATVQATLGISRASFYRRVQSGEVEVAEVGGRRFYRAAVRLTPDSQPVSVSRDDVRRVENPSPPVETRDETRAGVLALVTRYESRIDALLVERREAEGNAGKARDHAAALAVEVERARLERDHAHQVARLEIAAVEAAHQVRLEAVERTAREASQLAQDERQRREGAESRLEALEALSGLPWYRFGQRRRVRALLLAN